MLTCRDIQEGENSRCVEHGWGLQHATNRDGRARLNRAGFKRGRDMALLVMHTRH